MTVPFSWTDPARQLRPMGPVTPPPPRHQRVVGTAAAILAVVATVLTVLIGFAWPEGADLLLRLLVAGLVIGFAAVHTYRASGQLAKPLLRSPFDRRAVPDDVPASPRDLQALTRELDWSFETRRDEPMISLSVRARVRREAAARLLEHHGLRLAQPSDHERIRAIVSRPMWALIGPPPRATDRRQPVLLEVAVPISELDRVLDELENL